MFIKDDARSNAKTKPKVLCIMFLISTYILPLLQKAYESKQFYNA